LSVNGDWFFSDVIDGDSLALAEVKVFVLVEGVDVEDGQPEFAPTDAAGIHALKLVAVKGSFWVI
jgi:hypothetical protein